MKTARELGYVGCYNCGTVHLPTDTTCRTCGAGLVSRKDNSLQAVWAWLLTGLIFYIPANIYPLLVNRVLGAEAGHTIIEGIIIFFEKGDYFVAIVIAIASLVIPVAKFFVIGFLALSIHFNWNLNAHMRLVLYEIVEFIGRWSMIDVFVVALMAGLIQLGSLVSVLPGAGSICFALSVIFTMLSAQAIDTKSIWDTAPKDHANV